jgi:NTE family protein
LPPRGRQWSGCWRSAAVLWLLCCLSCAPLTRRLDPQQFPTAGGDGPGYRFTNLAGGKEENKLFVCMSFSGGGTRAAALAYGVMVALRKTRLEWPRKESLLDDVDCISAVSGGSFTAAYYGLFGDDLFDHFEQKFLYRNIQRALILKALGPWNWPWLASPYYSRSDLTAELYDDQIFEHKTY